MTQSKLTNRQRTFVAEYLIDLNATAAYRRSGYAARGNSAEVNAARLLRNAQVSEAINSAMAERSYRTHVTADRVLTELAKIAFFDIRELFENNASLKPIAGIPGSAAAAISSLEVFETQNCDQPKGFIKKIRTADKLRALELLGKHLNMFRDRLEVSGDDENPLTLLLKTVQGTALKPVPQSMLDSNLEDEDIIDVLTTSKDEK
jgi:phage terminase small subunit